MEAKIVKVSYYGQYKIVILIEHEEKKSIIKYHSTDRDLFHKAHGEDNHREIVIGAEKTSIENAVIGYINSL